MSASIGPFGSLTASGEILKLPVSEFQSSIAPKLRLPFLAALVHSGLAEGQTTTARIGARGPSEQSRCCRESRRDLVVAREIPELIDHEFLSNWILDF